MTEMHEMHQSRATTHETFPGSVRQSHKPANPSDEALRPQHGEMVVSRKQLTLTVDETIGSDGQCYDKLIQTYPNGALSTMDALRVLAMAYEDICNEGPDSA